MVNDGLIAPGSAGATVDAETTLLRRIAVGDRAAFADLYDRLSADALGAILATPRAELEPERAMLALRDTFLDVWRDADDLDPARETGRDWVLGLARRRAGTASGDAVPAEPRGERPDDGASPAARPVSPPPELRAIVLDQLDRLIASGVGPSALRDHAASAPRQAEPAGSAGPSPEPSPAPAPAPRGRSWQPAELSGASDDEDDDALRRGLTRRKRRQRFFAGIVAIALLLGVGSGALLSVLNPGGSEQGTTLEQVEGAEDGMRVTAQVPGGGEATLSWSARQGQAVLITEGMSAPDGGGSYELWLIRDATATSAGTFVPEEGLSAVPIMGVLAPGDTVIVTEEAADGSATGTPSTEPLLTFAVDAGERTRGDSDGIPA